MRAKIDAVIGARLAVPGRRARTDTVAGYAYATQFRDREAYRFTAEDSIYVHPDWMGQGIGGALARRADRALQPLMVSARSSR